MERYVLADGRQLVHVVSSTWRLLSLDGQHIQYLTALEVIYG